MSNEQLVRLYLRNAVKCHHKRQRANLTSDIEMTREQQLNTIITPEIRKRLDLMAADTVEAFVERVAIMHVNGRLPLYQAEHEAFEALKRSWQK